MDWKRVEGNWKEVKGKVKEKWAKLTDDDLTAINDHRDQLEGRLQQRYGYAKDQARRRRHVVLDIGVSLITGKRDSGLFLAEGLVNRAGRGPRNSYR
jgi:uncharacterized protein YjbJ (UPF0337 family)